VPSDHDEPDHVRRELDQLTADVVRRAPDAIAQVFLLTQTMLARIAFSILRDDAASQDVVQDVFLKLVEHADTLRDPDGRGLRAWLVRAVRNRSLDLVRSGRQRHEDLAAPLPDQPAQASNDATIGDPELLAALDRLTDDQREAVVLFHVGGLPGADVADVMDRNRAAVYRLLRRGERQMRIHLDRSNGSAPDRLSDDRRTP